MTNWRFSCVAGVVAGISGRVGTAKLFSCFGALLVLALTWGIVPMATAQETDPLCGSSVATGQWGQSNALTIGGSDAHLALVLSKFLQKGDNLGISSQLLTGANLSTLSYQSIERTVDIEPVGKVKAGDSTFPVAPKPEEVKSCSEAIRSLQGKVVDIKDRTYACALLDMDRKCLTNSESQPHVKDASIPFRSVAIVVVKQQAVCTGLLLDERSFKTARHCFINQMSGDRLIEFSGLVSNDWSIETLDGKRKISINAGEIDKLVVPGGFDIDQDPVTISVTVTASPGAKPLPQVKFKDLSDNNQLLWLVGPVHLLDQAIAMRQAALNPTAAPPRPSWRDSIRWSSLLGAQCRTVGIKDSCVYHSCQSFEGFSGSPMITSAVSGIGAAPDTIEYTGVHSGTPGIKKPFGWPGCTKSAPNFVASNYLIFNVGKKGD